MKTFEFNNLEVRTNKGKAIPELVHDYYPYPDDKNVIFKCKYLQNGETEKYTEINQDGRVSFKFSEIFKDKVLDIRGVGAIPAKGKDPIEIKTAEDFLAWPQVEGMNSLMMSVALHIMDGSKLTEDEIKNSN